MEFTFFNNYIGWRLLECRSDPMSLLSRKTSEQPKTAVSSSDVFFNFSPQTHPAAQPTAAKLKTQTGVMEKMKSSCPDLFQSNPGVKSVQQGNEIFHTSQLYASGGKNAVSMEELAHNLSEYDLCLAVSAISPEKNTTTLAMLDANHINEALKTNAEFITLKTGERGHMVVSFQKKNGLHWIKSIDYHL